MNEELIRQQTAVILDAYRELTGSTEIPGIGDFLKLRECAIRERGTLVAEDSAIIPAPKRAEQTSQPVPSAQNKRYTTDFIGKTEPKMQPASKVAYPEQQKQTPVTIVHKEEKKSERKSSATSAFAMLRSIQDPWNS